MRNKALGIKKVMGFALLWVAVSQVIDVPKAKEIICRPIRMIRDELTGKPTPQIVDVRIVDERES